MVVMEEVRGKKSSEASKKGHRSVRGWLARWLDECKMAAYGIVLATRYPRFVITTVVSFLVFGTLMNLLAAGGAAIGLIMAAPDWGNKLKVISDAFLKLFGLAGVIWVDWLMVFVVALLQGIVIGLVVLVWKKRRDEQKQNAANVQTAGLAAGLGVLGAGCPTCGTTLFTPLLVSVFGTGGYPVAGTISGVLTALAVIVILWSLKKMGLEAYVMIVSEKFKKRKAAENAQSV